MKKNAIAMDFNCNFHIKAVTSFEIYIYIIFSLITDESECSIWFKVIPYDNVTLLELTAVCTQLLLQSMIKPMYLNLLENRPNTSKPINTLAE